MRTGYIVSALALWCAAGLGASAMGAPVWQRYISDSYQHQRWGAPATGTVPTAADVAPADQTWQATYNAGANTVSFGGWCAMAAQVNMFYRFNRLGYRTFGPAGGGGNFNPTTVAEFQTEVKKLWTEYNPAAGAFNASGRPKKFTNVLNARGAGPDQGLAGLSAHNYRQVGADVKYLSADGVERIAKPNSKVLFVLPGLLGRGDSASIRMNANPAGTGSVLNWWNFHCVTVGGYDITDRTIWFADPDSNKGNTNAQAGWTAFDFAPAVAGDGILDWLAAPPGIGSKIRRFVEGGGAPDGIPVPAGAAPTNAERDSFYFPGKLKPDIVTFENNTAGYNRYNGVKVDMLETIETIKGIAKPAAPGAPAGAAKGFSVSANTGNDLGMTEFYLFSMPGQDVSVDLLSLAGTGWTASPFAGFDPLGNLRSSGWHFSAISLSDVLIGTEVLDFDYFRLSGVIDAWDLVYNNVAIDSITGLPVGDAEFFVQAWGDLAGYELDMLQVPGPGGLVVGLLGAAMLRRRRR